MLKSRAKPSFMAGVRHNKETIEAIGGFYDDLGRTIYTKQQNIPVIRYFGPDEINDIFNESMPATTKIGQLYGTGVGIGTELYKLYLDYNNKSNANE